MKKSLLISLVLTNMAYMVKRVMDLLVIIVKNLPMFWKKFCPLLAMALFQKIVMIYLRAIYICYAMQ